MIKQLVRVRTVLEKTKPIDAKLKYQVEKLVKEAEAARSGVNTTSSSGRKDKLSFKPNPLAMAEKLDQEEQEENDDEEDQVYKAPKLSATHFVANEKAAAKEREKEAARFVWPFFFYRNAVFVLSSELPSIHRLRVFAQEELLSSRRAKASKSSLVRHLREELYQDRPEEVHVFGAGDDKLDDEEEERKNYEEDNFMRLMETKDYAKKKAKKRSLRVNAFEDFDDFGDLTAMAERNNDKALNIDELSSASKRRKLQPTANDDDDAGFNFDMDESDMMKGMQMYADASGKSKKKKAEKTEKYTRPDLMMPEEDWDAIDAGTRRKVGKNIIKNRGLTRARPKDQKNPRVKHRKKYEKALIKRKGQVQEFSGAQSSYGGEKSGIKTNLTKSTKIKK